MANLIITVISIALVAVAALMGAYYGGTAFMDGQRNARINNALNLIQQTDAAYQLCMAQEPGGQAHDGTCDYTDLVSRNYLSEDPMIKVCDNSETLHCEESSYGYSYADVPGFFMGLFGTNDTTVTLAKNNVEFCKIIAAKGGGAPRLEIGTNAYTSYNYDRKMDCIVRDQDSSGTLTLGDYYWIYYKF